MYGGLESINGVPIPMTRDRRKRERERISEFCVVKESVHIGSRSMRHAVVFRLIKFTLLRSKKERKKERKNKKL